MPSISYPETPTTTDALQSVLDTAVAQGRERGVQLTAYLDGERVIDTWAGTIDAEGSRPVDGTTLFPVYSTTKGYTATSLHVCAERGLIDYDTPVAEYWPEFAASGKGDVLVRHVLQHTAGLARMPADVTVERLGDWEWICASLAATPPLAAPGVPQDYHAVTSGFLTGELVRRVSGRPIGEVLRDEVAAPIGDPDLYFGVPEDQEHRVSPVEEPAVTEPYAETHEPMPVPVSMSPLAVWMNEPRGRRTVVPASNGIATTRALARHYAALLPGGVDGVRLISPERMERARTIQESSSWGLGYIPATGQALGAFGVMGYGGSVAWADPELRLTVAFAPNLFTPEAEPGRTEILRTVFATLGLPDRTPYVPDAAG